MGELILCCGRIAAMPYYIEQASLNIYSIEELCYYMEQNPDRLDETFFGAELEQWIMQELKLTELAQKLQECREQKGGLTELVELVFGSCGYLTKKEAADVLTQLRELEHKDEFDRGRLRADRYVKNHRYAAGIREYQALLDMAEQTGKDTSCIGAVWHNMGVACAKMFLYEQAAFCMEKAYSYWNQPESLIEMYLAKQCAANINGASGTEIPDEWKAQVMERMKNAQETVTETKKQTQEERLTMWKKSYRLYSRL